MAQDGSIGVMHTAVFASFFNCRDGFCVGVKAPVSPCNDRSFTGSLPEVCAVSCAFPSSGLGGRRRPGSSAGGVMRNIQRWGLSALRRRTIAEQRRVSAALAAAGAGEGDGATQGLDPGATSHAPAITALPQRPLSPRAIIEQ